MQSMLSEAVYIKWYSLH